MNYDEKFNNLAVKLFNINAVKFGKFTTKSGITTPVYFDLRVIVSYPDVMELISSLIYEYAIKGDKSNHICGVPYTALPIATLLSVQAKKSMLMRRKESKGYGTNKNIEGHYKSGQTCLIVEDVVTSGSSVLETAKDLRKEGLKVEKAIVVLDREQKFGGCKNLQQNDIQVVSLFTMSKLLEILVKHEKIAKHVELEVLNYLKVTQTPIIGKTVDRTLLSYEERECLAYNKIAKELFHVMATKKTNLCLSVDFTSTEKILNLLEKVGDHICMVKTHIDIIEDFNSDFINSLKQLAKRFKFLILEDRKYADIGNTVSLQYSKGMYRVCDWADCVTVHSLPGHGILKSFDSTMNGNSKGCFLLAEMSSEGNLITPSYTNTTVQMAFKYPGLITGFVCQNKQTFEDPGWIQLTPGVQLQNSIDNFSQVYNTPEKIILNGADVAVVGRGIICAKDPESETILYKNALWEAYLKRISKN